MLFNQTNENSPIGRDRCSPSVFRPPKFLISTAPSKKTLAATAQPWYPSTHSEKRDADISRASSSAPPALDFSSNIKPKAAPYLASDESTPSLDGGTVPFSPLSTPINCFFHAFSDDATERRVYPMNMFLSARKDASHTPHGVLRWCMRQYLEVSALKVPAHLQLSMNEVISPEDGVTRGALGSHLKLKSRPILVRQTRHKVMSILSRITPQKYDDLLDELLKLPLRQTDDVELHEIVKVFFNKAVQEPEYNGLYAQLLQTLCTMRDDERKLEVELWDRLLCHRMRHLLISACEEEFRRPARLTPDEQVDRTTGKPLSKEELEMKHTRLKNRLVGNIKFVGELFKMSLITESVIVDILRSLVWDYSISNPLAKEDYVFEVFAMLVKTVAPLLRDSNPEMLSRYLGIAKDVEVSHPRPRVRFLMMDLSDLNIKNGWVLSFESRTKNINSESMNYPKSLAETVQSSVASTGITTPTEKNLTRKGSSADLAPAPITPSVSMNDITSGVLNINAPFRDSTMTASLPTTSGRIMNSHSPTTNSSNLYNTHINGTSNFLNDSQMSCAQGQRIGAAIQRNSIRDSPTASYPKTNTQSTFSLGITASELSSGVVSEGVPTPILKSAQPLSGSVNIDEVTQHLIELFNRAEEEENVLRYFNRINFKNKVLCLTWWLRRVSTDTSLFRERERVTNLLSKILLSCPSFKPNDVFIVIVEWIRFDIEKALFNDCPDMFSNIAHMISYSYSGQASQLSNIHDIRELLHAGLFNIMLHELILRQHTDQMMTLAKCAYPVCMSILNSIVDSHNPSDILRVAVENRFLMLQYFLCTSNGLENDILHAPRRRCRTLTATLKCNTPNGQDDIPLTGHYDPLADCFSFYQISDDPELVLYRSIVSEKCPQRRQEAIKLALSADNGASMVSQLIQFMKVIGVLLACTNILAHKDNVDLLLKVNEEIAPVFSFRKGTLFEAAAVMELIIFFAQALPCRMEVKSKDKCIKPLLQVFGRWCNQGLVDKKAVMEMIRSLVNIEGNIEVFTTYYNSITCADLSLSRILNCLL